MPTYIKDLELRQQHVETFQSLAKSWKEPVALIIAQMDPDGAASAKLLRAALEHEHVEVAGIFFAGAIGHRQNHKIFNQFDLAAEILPIAQMPENCLQFLVDSSKIPDTRLRDTRFSADRVIGFIDHHHTNGKVPERSARERFMWNAPSAAATTLVWTLAKKLGVAVDQPTATLAAIGIYTDSNRLASEYMTPQDVEAYAQAMQAGRAEWFAKCCNYRLTKRCRQFLAEVLMNSQDVGEFQISHPSSHLTEDDGDDISLYADHMHKYEGSHTTIVWGLCGDWIRYSIRSNGDLNVNDLLHKLFGKETGGTKQGSGGGRFRLPEQFAPCEESSGKFIEYFSTHCQQKLREFAGITDDVKNGKTA